MKKCFAIMLSSLLFVSISLQGCTTMPDQPYLKKETSEATPLKLARYETPRLRVYTNGGLVASIVVGGVIIGVIGAGIGYAIYYAVSREPVNPDVHDFGKLVMDKFVERSKTEIPNWPTMLVQEGFAVKEAPIDTTSYVLTIDVGDVKVNADSGLSVDTTITMKDREGNVVWQKGYWYDPAYFNRISTFDDLKANRFKKLNEEFAFAAEQTVSNFITHFNNSRPVAVSKN